MEMEAREFGHIHPMEERSHETKGADCGRCGKAVSGPCFSCAECGFSLHKNCAEAPSKIVHPYHPQHPLVLRSKPPCRECLCRFCGENCESFAYHCSCNCELNFHIKCALFTLGIAEKKPELLKHIDTKDPPVVMGEVENGVCLGCWEPLRESTYFSVDGGFNLHKKCAQLPLEINHPFHKQHPLVLQFNTRCIACNICRQTLYMGVLYCCTHCKFALHIKCAQLPCQISNPSHRRHPLVLQSNSEKIPCKACQETETKTKKFVYSCLPCKFVLHTKCATPKPFIKGKYHQHTFTLFWRQASFICDACGLEGNSVSYTCLACNLVIHQKCASIPPIIRVPYHHHPISHNYFLSGNESKNRDCEFCGDEVNIDYGCYYCSDCNFIAHVKCAMEEGWYVVLEAKDKELDDPESANPITRVIEQNESGEMTRIQHLSHAHDLILSENFMGNDKTCDGCMLLISTSFYYCSSNCGFYLHKICAESLRKKLHWSHRHMQPLILVVGIIFKCQFCRCESSGFAYKCKVCKEHYCLPCVVNRSYRITHPGHEHPLLFLAELYLRQCNGCGKSWLGLYRCKRCDFNVDECCASLPLTIRDRCDEHPLELTCHEVNDYSEYHYCDICEEERDPNHWFYHCATCDLSAHPQCVPQSRLLIKPGSIYIAEDHHLHPLTFVRKPHCYLQCRKCCRPCEDLALECADSACNYTVHWGCVKPANFASVGSVALYKTQADC